MARKDEEDFADTIQAFFNDRDTSELFGETVAEQMLDRIAEHHYIANVNTFKEQGVLSENAGVVVSLACGEEFQITIVQSHDVCGQDELDEWHEDDYDEKEKPEHD